MTPWWLRRPEDNPADRPATTPSEPAEAPVAGGDESEPAPTPWEPLRADEESTRIFTAVEGADDGGSDEAEDDGPGSDSADEEGAADAPAAPGEGEGATEAERARSRRRRGRRRGGRGNGAAEGAARADDPADEPVDESSAAPVAPPPVARGTRPSEGALMAAGFEQLARELVAAVAPIGRQDAAEERKIAMFCDLENVALGVRDSEVKRFDIELVLERLLEKGKIIVKRAYADWERYSEFKIAFHESAIELIDIPQRRMTGKNSADIKMVVDAMDLCYAKEHLDTFVLLSGDSDFSPLVSKLKENNKYVIGIGLKNSSSALLVDNCDEFLYYEDLWRDQQKAPQLDGLPKKKAEVFALMIDAILALMRENKDVLWGSMIKETMKRKKPSFNEGYFGYSTFSELLEDAERSGIIKLRKDRRSGTYVVEGWAGRR